MKILAFQICLVSIFIGLSLSCKKNSKSSSGTEACSGEYITTAKFPATIAKNESAGIIPGETCNIRESMLVSNFFMLEDKLHVKVIGYKEGHVDKDKDCPKEVAVVYEEEKCVKS